MRWYFLLLRHGMRFDGHGGERLSISALRRDRPGPRWRRHLAVAQFVGAKRAYELMAFGEKLGAEKAVEWGLANRVLPDDDFAGHAMTFAQELAGRSLWAFATQKRRSPLVQRTTWGIRYPRKRRCRFRVLAATILKRRSKPFLKSVSPIGRANNNARATRVQRREGRN